MLQLTTIQAIDENNFLVTIERDGQSFEYNVHYSVSPAGIPGIGMPDQAYADLIDYEFVPPPEQRAWGAIYIPALRRVVNQVYRFADHQPVELPVVLDERSASEAAAEHEARAQAREEASRKSAR